ncbi:MAG: hypothetical protein EOM22_14885 [Gammaproteobacteria bacterium]|nr:hypothetical protein [Gammaproteobacteria bacterium]
MRLVTHIKTGREYQYLGTAVDCTNARDGVVAVLYRRKDNPDRVFAREQCEFWETFEWAKEVKA